MRGRCARPWPSGSWRASEGVGALGRRVVSVSAGAESGVPAGVLCVGAESGVPNGVLGVGAGTGALAEVLPAGAGGLCRAPASDAASADAGSVLVTGGRTAAGSGPSPGAGGVLRGCGRAGSCLNGAFRRGSPAGLSPDGGGDRPSGRCRLAGDAAAHRGPRTGTAGGARGGNGSVRGPRRTACCLFRRGCRILEVWSLSGTSRASGKRAEGEGAGDECRRTCS